MLLADFPVENRVSMTVPVTIKHEKETQLALWPQ
jgi:hypothetical protein